MVRFILLMLALSTTAHAVTWKLEVRYPDHELKTFAPPKDDNFKINVGKSQWSCVLTPPEEDKKDTSVVHTREVLCVMGKDDTSVVGTRTACVVNKHTDPYNSSNLHLISKAGNTVILLTCE